MLILLLSLVVAYLIGSIPTSFIFAKLLKHTDIRKEGSGNVGATNVFRVVGKIPAVTVLLLDVLKGVVVVAFLPDIFFNNTIGIILGLELYKIILGACGISGHVWSVFLKFKGGKGVATTAGVLLALAPKVLLSSLFIWIVIFAALRIVSVASIAASVLLPVFAILFRAPASLVFFTVFLCVMGTYKHKANIRRLLRGEEKKLFIFLISFCLAGSLATGAYARQSGLYETFKSNPEIKVYLGEVTSEIEDPRVKIKVFEKVFLYVIPRRINLKFVSVKNPNEADVVVTAKIKGYKFKERALPSFLSSVALLADMAAPKSAAKLVVDYKIATPAGNVLLEYKGFTTNQRRPRKDMAGENGFMHAANKNINRFLYRAFYKQRPKI